MERYSGFELLKIVAMLAIVLGHTTQTLSGVDGAIIDKSLYVFDIEEKMASDDFRHIVLLLFGNLGCFGNTVFFACSAWFLCTKEQGNIKKIPHLLFDVWVISVLFLVLFMFAEIPVASGLIRRSLFPNVYSNNWYITCYALFYLSFPALNLVIKNMDKRIHFNTITVMIFLYFCICFIKPGMLFASIPLYWLCIYFIIAYCRRYMKDWFDRNINLSIMVAIGGGIVIGEDLVMNYLGIYIDLFSNKANYWHQLNNPWMLLLTLGLCGFANKLKFKIHIINVISSFTLFIYIFHENILVRTYFRPTIWSWIKTEYGYDMIVLYDVIFAGVLFIGSLLMSVVYNRFCKKYSKRICDVLCKYLLNIYNKSTVKILKQN